MLIVTRIEPPGEQNVLDRQDSNVVVQMGEESRKLYSWNFRRLACLIGRKLDRGQKVWRYSGEFRVHGQSTTRARIPWNHK